jgi:hypothetical protein
MRCGHSRSLEDQLDSVNSQTGNRAAVCLSDNKSPEESKLCGEEPKRRCCLRVDCWPCGEEGLEGGGAGGEDQESEDGDDSGRGECLGSESRPTAGTGG